MCWRSRTVGNRFEEDFDDKRSSLSIGVPFPMLLKTKEVESKALVCPSVYTNEEAGFLNVSFFVSIIDRFVWEMMSVFCLVAASSELVILVFGYMRLL